MQYEEPKLEMMEEIPEEDHSVIPVAVDPIAVAAVVIVAAITAV